SCIFPTILGEDIRFRRPSEKQWPRPWLYPTERSARLLFTEALGTLKIYLLDFTLLSHCSKHLYSSTNKSSTQTEGHLTSPKSIYTSQIVLDIPFKGCKIGWVE
ncbi:hypothetical protein LEMLEM_LOCUS18989, partial [Lemmus lemmus]